MIGLIGKKDITYEKWKIFLVMIVILILDYIRFYKVKGITNLVQEYNDASNKNRLNPIIYFILSIAYMVLLKFLGFIPNIS